MQNISLSEYFNIDQKITSFRNRKKFKKRIKIALLGSFTLNGFKEVLNVKCHNLGLKASFYVSDYTQYINEIIDKNTRFYKFEPDITYLLVDIKSILGELYFNPYKVSETKRKKNVKYNYRRLKTLVDNFIKFGSGILVINNFEIPTYSPIGILEPKENFGYFDMIRSLNSCISKFNEHRSVFVFDYDSFASEIGKRNIRDDKLLYLADMKISPEVIPDLCEEYMRYIKALKGLTRKCIVLDMDNTLWGGIIGEDGFERIKLGPTPPGNAFMEFQKYLLALFHKGIILAINSNNNRDDAIGVLRRHPYMILKEHHFASLKINWESKVKNMVEIARDINIGLDSLIFLEDDKRTRQVVREALPGILCPELPEDISYYPKFLANIKDIDTLQITREDKKRGKRYVAERKREESVNAFEDISKYLAHLKIIVEIKSADKFGIPRLSQLSLRTNQFNFSTKRYSEKEIEKFVSSKKHNVYYVSVKDKYGDYGITGLLIMQKNNREWFIDTFLMSCRILGRNIEDAVLSVIIKKAIKTNIQRVKIDYKKTEKNTPVVKFMQRYGILKNIDKPENTAITLYEKGRKLKFRYQIGHVKVVSK